MSPNRKLVPDADQTQAPTQTPVPSPQDADPRRPGTAPVEEAADIVKEMSKAEASTSRRSLYARTLPGTPPGKAAPITELAKEEASAVGQTRSTAIHKSRNGRRSSKSSSSSYMSPKSSVRSLPLTAMTTKLHITSSGSSDQGKVQDPKSEPPRQPEQSEINGKANHRDEQPAELPETDTELCEQLAPVNLASNRQSWLGWFSRNDPVVSITASATESNSAQANQATDEPKPVEVPEESAKNIEVVDEQAKRRRSNSDPNPVSRPGSSKGEIQAIDSSVNHLAPPRSWFGLWNASSTSTDMDSDNTKAESGTKATATASEPQSMMHAEDPQSSTPSSGSTDTAKPAEVTSFSSWAFWNRSSASFPVAQELQKKEEQPAATEIPLEAKLQETNADHSKILPKSMSTIGRRMRPRSLDLGRGYGAKLATSATASDGKGNEAAAVALPASPATSTIEAKKTQSQVENLLLPTLQSTYTLPASPGLLQKLSQLLSSAKHSTPKHAYLLREPPRIKKALAIGIHGYFPAPLIRTVLGQPRGTSVRFADNAAEAIRGWGQSQKFRISVEKIALEGEGKIEERVELLWKLLLNYIDKVREADFVLIACHSQGVPVAIQLVSKLISFGCVNDTRIGVCAMAGVSLGPFVDYKSRWISGSAGELFEFSQPNSKVSIDYEVALDVALKFGVKVTYVGSIDDQLVSMDSSTFSTAEHPNIYRAVFINGQVHAPHFLTHLVGFVLKLRNLGIPDHGLIRELSSSLGGSLYTGDGHSRLYEDVALYRLAVAFALETTTVSNVPLKLNRSGLPSAQNPYILPFAMRGVLEEEFVRTELSAETTELLKQFDDWKPATKGLKDVKFRLEGVRSKI